MREAITSCRRFRISRAEVAAEILMFHRYQKAVAVSNGMMRATSFCQRKSVADLSPRASPAPQSPRLSAPQESAQPALLPSPCLPIARPSANRLRHLRRSRPGEGRLPKNVRSEVGPRPFRSRLRQARSEEHTSELQSIMRLSYAVFFLTKKNQLT